MKTKTRYDKQFAKFMKTKSNRDAFKREQMLLDIAYGIEHIRKEKHLSQRKLAAMAGIPQQEISKIERGERNITIDTLTRLAVSLKVKPVIQFKHI
jgi:ribosome-binding protein aMBF1 (putative translation factor)